MMKAIPGIVPFLYMDDRSIVDANDDPALPTALATTQWCDARLGFKEHLGKRQTWTKNDSVEHLGLTVQHGVPSLPAGRASTDLLCELAQAVSGLPGNMEAILLAVVLPKLLWSAPLVPAVEQRLVDSFLRACRGRCTWWCKGRVWADHVTLHPRFACAVKCLALAPAHWQQRCATLRAAVKHHASVLSLRVEPARAGLCLGPKPSASARVREVVRRVGLPRGQPYFDPAADDGHTLRMVARALALDSVNRNRWDSEGIDDVDLWVQAQPTEPSCGSGEVVPSELGPGGGTTPARTASTTSAVSVGLPSPVRGICLPNARGFRICAIPCRSFMTCPLAGSLPNLGLRQNSVGLRLVPVLLTVTGCRLS